MLAAPRHEHPSISWSSAMADFPRTAVPLRGRVGEGVAARKKADRRAPIARPPPPPLPTRGGEPTRRDSCREILPAVRPIRHRRGRAPAGTSMAGTEDEGGLAEPSAHYLGHRKRLRDRFLAAGA